MTLARNIFSVEEKKQIIAAIKAAESGTSGEIRVHVEDRHGSNPADRATVLFHVLKMDQTKLRNGVLIYLAVKDHAFFILGDAGINEVVPKHFWQEVSDQMQQAFKAGAFADGVVAAIEKSAEKLKVHFPVKPDDENELPDEISISDDV